MTKDILTRSELIADIRKWKRKATAFRKQNRMTEASVMDDMANDCLKRLKAFDGYNIQTEQFTRNIRKR